MTQEGTEFLFLRESPSPRNCKLEFLHSTKRHFFSIFPFPWFGFQNHNYYFSQSNYTKIYIPYIYTKMNVMSIGTFIMCVYRWIEWKKRKWKGRRKEKGKTLLCKFLENSASIIMNENEPESRPSFLQVPFVKWTFSFSHFLLKGKKRNLWGSLLLVEQVKWILNPWRTGHEILVVNEKREESEDDHEKRKSFVSGYLNWEKRKKGSFPSMVLFPSSSEF